MQMGMRRRITAAACRKISKGAAAALLAVSAAAVLAVTGAGPAAAQQAPAAEHTPKAAVERLHAALEEAAAEHEGVDARYERLQPVVEATHDLSYIAELTVRREWAELSDRKRRRFVEAFTRLSVMTYASRFGGLKPGMFEVGKAEALSRGRARVTATLTTAGGDAIPFEYVLHEADGGWKIVNILADDVSDLALKRAEYRRLLQQGSIDDVIAALERQAEEAAREAGASA